MNMKLLKRSSLQKLKAILLVVFFAFTIADAMAGVVTVKVDSGGKWRYRIQHETSWSAWSSYYTENRNLTVTNGDNLQVQAVQNTKYFVNWTEGNGTEVAYDYGDYSFVVDGNRTIHANYTSTHYTITATASPSGSGNRVRIHDGVNWSAGESVSREVGEGAKCRINTYDSYWTEQYGFWKYTLNDELVSYSQTISFNVSAAASYVAHFRRTWNGDLRPGTTYTLTTNSNGTFHVSSSGNTEYDGDYDVIGTLNVNYPSSPNSSSAVLFNTTAPVYVKGSLNVNYGHLKLWPGDSPTYNHSHLKRDDTNSGSIIYVTPAEDLTDMTKCKLTIRAKGNLSDPDREISLLSAVVATVSRLTPLI